MRGRILITGSIAGYHPRRVRRPCINGTKAFIDSFSFALRNELKDTDVTVTCLMPGATETEFFERAGMEDTKVGQAKKDDPAEVAEAGFKAMMDGDGDIVTGWKNKIQTTIANVVALQRAGGAEPQAVRARLGLKVRQEPNAASSVAPRTASSS